MSRHEQVAQQQKKTTPVAARTPALDSPVPAATSAPDLLGLQRAVGNRAVLSLLGAQASLVVGAADDPYEREADAVARQVTAQLRQEVVPLPAAGGAAGLEEEEGVARMVHRHASHAGHLAPEVGRDGGTLSEGLEREVDAARGGGSALPSGVRGKMEGAFGVDFSSVRVHEGSQASELNRKLGAQAFTIGSDIFFGGASPSLSSADGSSLLAHELTHVVQQGAAGSLD